MFNTKNCPNWVTHVDETGITRFHKTRNVIGVEGKKYEFEDCHQVKGRFW